MPARISENLEVQVKNMVNLAGKTILMIVAPEGFRDEELLEPKKIFENHNANVKIASKGVSVARGKLGAKIDVDYDIDEVIMQDYDAVVFVGGPGAAVYFDDETAHSIAREALEEDEILGAICIAPVILANAGLLKGKKATVFPSGADDLKKNGAKYTGKDVEADGKIVTANGPAAAKKFGEKIAEMLR
jgi:protease I